MNSIQGPIDVLKDVVGRLEKARIQYFLVGSLAAMYYGRPRFTRDIDLVLQLNLMHALEFEKLFLIEEYYCPPKEVIQDEVLRRGSFNLIHQDTGLKIDIVLYKDTEYHKSQLLRRI